MLIADDQGMVRTGFTVFLGSQPDIEVVGEAADGRQAVARVAELRPDVVLMDVRMPVMDGPAATRAILGGGGRGGAARALGDQAGDLGVLPRRAACS